MANNTPPCAATTGQEPQSLLCMGIHPGTTVLGSAPLWNVIMEYLPGYPSELVRFYRACLAPHDTSVHTHKNAFMQLLARDASLTHDGLLSHLAVVAGKANVLRLVHKLTKQHQQWHHPHRPSHSTQQQQTRQVDPKLSFARVMHCAVVFRRVDMLECIAQLRLSDPAWPFEPDLFVTALRRPADADTNVLTWLHAHFPPASRMLSPNNLLVYARTKRVDVAQWLLKHGCTISQRTLDAAVRGRYAPMLAFLYAHSDCHCSCLAFEDAAQHGYIALVEIIVTAAVAVDRTHFNASVAAAHFHISSDSDCLHRAMAAAAGNGQLPVVQLLHPYCTTSRSTRAIDTAARNGHLEILEFFHNHRNESCSHRAMDSAAANGHLEVLEFLHRHHHEGCTPDALTQATRHKHVDAMRFLCAQRPRECDVDAALVAAAHSGDIATVKLFAASLQDGKSTYVAVKTAVEAAKSAVVRLLVAHDGALQQLLQHAIADGAAWVVQALCALARIDDLLDAKELVGNSKHLPLQQQTRLVAIIERQIRTLHMRDASVAHEQ